MLKDEIKKKNQLTKWAKSTRIHLPNLDHDIEITSYKTNKKNYETQFQINPMLKDEIIKISIKKGY
jgi:hypothetical protein